MSLPFELLSLTLMAGVVLWLRRSARRYRPGAGPWYIEDGFLVLNYRLPVRHRLKDLDRVEFARREGALLVWLVFRNGRRKGYFRFREPPPELGKRWQRDLEAWGVRCLWI